MANLLTIEHIFVNHWLYIKCSNSNIYLWTIDRTYINA